VSALAAELVSCGQSSSSSSSPSSSSSSLPSARSSSSSIVFVVVGEVLERFKFVVSQCAPPPLLGDVLIWSAVDHGCAFINLAKAGDPTVAERDDLRPVMFILTADPGR
jgi:hypothetical protein